MFVADRSRFWIMAWVVALGGYLSGIPSFAFSQSWSPAPSSWVRESTLRSVFFLNEKTGWACGDRGTLLRTSDSGLTWELTPTPVPCRLDSIFFIDAQQGWACGGHVLPVSNRSQGVVLTTKDGGTTWSRLPTSQLTWLRKIEFDSPTNGWAIGAKTAHQPSGVYYTRDGGKNWLAAADFGESSWQAGSKFNSLERVLIGSRGDIQRLRADKFEPGYVLDGQQPRFCAVQTVDEKRAWAVGERGAIYYTTNQGLSWKQGADPNQIPCLTSMNFKTVVARGNHAWMTGQPASVVMHTHDDGRTWQWTKTGMDVDIECLHFVNDQAGWAVGGLGKIYATRDGGLTWTPQRNASLQIFALQTSPNKNSIPIEAVARISANEGWLASGVYPRGPESNIEIQSFPELGAEQWLSLGGMSQVRWWTPQVVPRDQNLSEKSNTESSQTNGEQWADWREFLTLQIRAQRPAVVILPAPRHHRLNRGEQFFHDLCLEACRDAGRPDRYPMQISLMGLQPWKPAKVFAISDRKVSSGIMIPTDQFALQIGRTLSDLCLPSRAGLCGINSAPPRQYQLTLIETDLPVTTAGKSLDRDLSLNWVETSRRPISNHVSGTFQNVQQLTSISMVLAQLGTLTSKSDPTGAIWIATVRKQLASLDDWSGGNFLQQIARQHLEHEQIRMGARAHRLMVEEYSNHPLADASLLWLWEHYSSHEWRWHDDPASAKRTIKDQNETPASETPTFQEMVQQAKISGLTEEQILDATGNLGVGDIDPIEIEKGQAIKPVFLFQPDALQDLEGEPAQLRLADLNTNEKEEYLRRLEQFLMTGRSALLSDWRLRLRRSQRGRTDAGTSSDWNAIRELFPETLGKIAEQELWLMSPLTHEPPTYLVDIQSIDTPPTLDGTLDEPYWQEAWEQKRLTLRLANHSKIAPSHIMLACDDRFLYIAAVCQKIHDAPYPTVTPSGKRDGASSDIDHIDFFLDLDRDHQTSFRLRCDSLGQATDSIGESIAWDPQWFVSHSESKTTWTIEVAIPFDQLGETFERNKTCWSLGIKRSCPGFGTAFWGLSEPHIYHDSNPLIQGLASFPSSQFAEKQVEAGNISEKSNSGPRPPEPRKPSTLESEAGAELPLQKIPMGLGPIPRESPR